MLQTHTTESCLNNSGGLPWRQLIGKFYPGFLFHSQEAVSAFYGDSEWIIVTGGSRRERISQNISSFPMEYESMGLSNGSFSDDQIPGFPVSIMNLTHANIYGEALWSTMTFNENWNDLSPNMNLSEHCARFSSNATNDPWKRDDLWKDAVPCAPSPRQGHLTVVLNSFLYVFYGSSDQSDMYSERLNGYSEFIEDESNSTYLDIDNVTDTDNSIDEQLEIDSHVYRIAISDILANNWSAWRRILPRNPIKSRTIRFSPLEGGLWKQFEDDLPKLVGVIPISMQSRFRIWLYDFTEDSWELYMDIDSVDYTSSYSARVIQNALLLTSDDTRFSYSMFLVLDLRSKEANIYEELQIDRFPPVMALTSLEVQTSSAPFSIILGICNAGNSEFHFHAAELKYSFGSYEISLLNVVQDEESAPPCQGEHLAVMSRSGQIYFFGGNGTESVWQINIGKDSCGLEFYHPIQSCVYDCPNEGDSTAQANLMFVMFFAFFFFWAYGLGNATGWRGQGQPTSIGRGRGLTTAEIETFPQRIWCEEAEHLPDQTCSICLVEFCNGEVIRSIPCGHVFHATCLSCWLQSETTCPLCREICQPVIQDRSMEYSNAMSFSLQWLPWNSRVRSTDPDLDDGLELRSVYSLQLHEDNDNLDGGSDSVISDETFNRNSTSENFEGTMPVQRRHHLGIDGEGTEPLCNNPESVMV
jgi:Ring finger domain